MCSGGFRLGAWDYLRWGHVEPISRNDIVVAAKVTIYAGENEEYYTFISGEAYPELASWMKYREEAGEKITKDSWVMRDLWDARIRRGRGKPATPKKLQSVAIKRLIERAHWSQGLRTKLPEGKKRHQYQAVHSLRKYFKTKCEAAGMKPINVEILMGHSVGISDSYYRPTEKDLLEDYLRVVDALTISPTAQLNNEVEKLKVETKQMERMNSEINNLKGKLSDNSLTLRTILTAISELSEHFRIYQQKAREYIPKLYYALTLEEQLHPEDARARIEKDCIQFWKIATIRDALPPECKDPVKVKAGKATPHHSSARLNRAEDQPSAESKQLITVGSNGLQILEEPASSTSTGLSQQQLQEELTKKESELQDLRQEFKKLSNIIDSFSSTKTQPEEFQQLKQQIEFLEKENEELRASIAQSTVFTPAKELEGEQIEYRIPNAKLSELFVAIRMAITRKRDIFVKFDKSGRFVDSKWDKEGVILQP